MKVIGHPKLEDWKDDEPKDPLGQILPRISVVYDGKLEYNVFHIRI